ncbi:hypothetical protein TIFTF001_004302 [Ficus carica]|uniref:Uncharacterized protein n=1 Tax=Ficus carica TaxID=3494 RepID=A0AA88A423_FICCA|nr:hypothetical protein TIFTF001_004302 [Ficus carica]
MAVCCSWCSGKVAVARLTAIPSYATMESTARRSWSSGEVAISSPSRLRSRSHHHRWGVQRQG